MRNLLIVLICTLLLPTNSLLAQKNEVKVKIGKDIIEALNSNDFEIFRTYHIQETEIQKMFEVMGEEYSKEGIEGQLIRFDQIAKENWNFMKELIEGIDPKKNNVKYLGETSIAEQVDHGIKKFDIHVSFSCNKQQIGVILDDVYLFGESYKISDSFRDAKH